jgi:uncharacterized protein
MLNFLRKPGWKTWLAVVGAIGAAGLFLWLNTSTPRLALFWVFGLGLGFVLQRSRFCFVSAVSNCFVFKDTRLLEGITMGLFVATIGFGVIMFRIMPEPGPGFIRSGALVTPFGWHLVLGGAMFGLGMMLAGGCIVGNLYRIGEGAVASVVAFAGILAGMGILQFNWPWWWKNYVGKQSAIWLPAEIGWFWSIALTLGVIAIIYIILRIVRGRSAPAESVPCEAVPPWPARVSGWFRAMFKTAWPLAAGGIVLGIINVLMYRVVDRPWTVTGEIMTWSQGLFDILHIPPPPMGAVPGT